MALLQCVGMRIDRTAKPFLQQSRQSARVIIMAVAQGQTLRLQHIDSQPLRVVQKQL